LTIAAPLKNERGAQIRERLLYTALRLYAAEGINGVSLRRISAEAGSKNSAAMHYHFDNKLGVIEALLEMISRELYRIDTTLRSSSNKERTLRNAFYNTLRPLAVLPKEQDWGGDAVRFLSRLAIEGDAQVAAKVTAMFAPFWQYLDRALAEELPDLPHSIRRLRIMLISSSVIHGIAEVSWLTNSPLGDLNEFDDDTLFNHLVDYLIGGLQAPSNLTTNPQHEIAP